MKNAKTLLVVALLGLSLGAVVAQAAFSFGRSYYSSWSYYPSNSYYYSSYYYKPYADYSGYKYHYCIYYPSTPQYTYYYNPYSNAYWGRYDFEAKGYSLLAENDRKKNLKDIPETAFPKPGKMPGIPESEDGATIPPPDRDSLPKVQAPKDVPPVK